MQQALGERGITKQEKVLDSKNRVHADSVLASILRGLKEDERETILEEWNHILNCPN